MRLVSLKIMNSRKKFIGISKANTFCQILREIYFKTDDKDIKLRCRMAVGCAKEVVKKLKKFRGIFKISREEEGLVIRKHNPVPESDMENVYNEENKDICEFLRDIYSLTSDEEIRLKVRISMSMANSMYRKLENYEKKMMEDKDGMSQ